MSVWLLIDYPDNLWGNSSINTSIIDDLILYSQWITVNFIEIVYLSFFSILVAMYMDVEFKVLFWGDTSGLYTLSLSINEIQVTCNVTTEAKMEFFY